MNFEEILTQRGKELAESAKRQHEAQEQKRREEEDAIRHLVEARLQEKLSPEFYAGLEWSWKHEWPNGRRFSRLTFLYGKRNWSLALNEYGTWEIARSDYYNHNSFCTIASRIPIDDLENVLVGKLLAHKQELKEDDLKQEVQERARELREKRAAEEQAVREQENTEILAEQQLEDGSCRALLDAERKRLQEAMFHWPAEVSLRLYLMSYYDSPSQEKRQAWTTENCLTNDGWIMIPETGRPIRLSDQSHYPIFEAFTFSSVDNLPHELKRTVRLCIEGIYVKTCVDGKKRLTSQGEAPWDYDCNRMYYSENLGEEPVEWVKKLIQ